MKNLHVIPTPNPSSLYKCRFKGHFILDPMNDLEGCFEEGFDPQNIYITSDEEIKEGDYVTDGIEVIKASPKLVDAQSLINRREWKKIILTTDTKLIEDGVQAIDDDFLEWFVKNSNCEEVKTERSYSMSQSSYSGIEYEIIIPKKEPFKHKCRVLTTEEVMEGRSNAYDFIDFDKETFDQYLQRLKDRRTEDNYKYTDEDFKNYIHHIFDCYEKNISVYKCLEFMYFIEREVKLEDVFNDEKKEDVKKVISEHKEKLQKEQDEFAIKFANWLRKEDTPENAEKWFHYSDMDMLNAFKEEQLKK